MPQSAAPVFEGLQLRSLATEEGRLELSLVRVETPEPAEGEVVVRLEASPINPSDLGLLLGAADLSAAVVQGEGESRVLSAPLSEAGRRAMGARIGRSLPVGNEGAGVVIAAGRGAEALLGRTVAILGGAMYAQHRLLKAADCLLLPEGASAIDGASCFVNPLTALGMVETMRREGHHALIHTAAASNLGQMLNRICLKDGVPLVNIVRSSAQESLLREAGALHVCDSSKPDFMEALVEAVAEADATLGFDAVGGGRLASQILTAMEAAAGRKATGFSRYGSTTHKQVYIYGGLDLRPTELTRSYGMAWGLGGWLLTPFLEAIGPEGTQRLRQRVADELFTTFKSGYARQISLFDVLDPAILSEVARRATGEKALIIPSRF